MKLKGHLLEATGLYLICNWTYQQIAERYGCSRQAVHLRLKPILEALDIMDDLEFTKSFLRLIAQRQFYNTGGNNNGG